MSEATQRFLCVNCDLPFESDEGDDARCPKCMRKGAITRPAETAAPARKLPIVGIAVVLGVIAVLGAGFWAWRRTRPATVGETVPSAPLDARTYRGHLVRLGVDTAENRALFESTDAVESLLGSDVDHGSWPERARAIAARYARLRASGRIVAPDEHGNRRGAFLTPDALAKELLRPSGATEAGSLELALLAVVALRDEDVPSRIVEIRSFEGVTAPPDRAGTNGYYGVLVRRRSGSDEVDLVDVAGEASRRVASNRRLDDLAVVAAALTARAQIALARDHDGSGALATADDAIRIDPQSVSARTLRASLLAASGAIDDAVSEAEAAEGLRSDPPRLVMLASMLIGRQEMTRAESLARRAIAIDPDFAAGYGILVATSLSRRDVEGARAALTTLEAKDPTFDGLALLQANFFLMTGDVDRAVERIEGWVRQRPSEPLVRLQAAHTLGLVGRTDAALSHLRAALGMVEGTERDALRDQIGRAFGPGVLAALVEGAPAAPADAPAQDAPEASDDAEVPPAPTGLQLGSPTLGGRMNRPSILGPR